MAKPNYAFAKRQRDLAKKAKKEEKRQRKAQAGAAGTILQGTLTSRFVIDGLGRGRLIIGDMVGYGVTMSPPGVCGSTVSRLAVSLIRWPVICCCAVCRRFRYG